MGIEHIVHLDNGEWTYSYNDGEAKHGQHYKMCGSCGYVNYHLMDKLFADTVLKRIREEQK